MIIKTEEEMLVLGNHLAQNLPLPAVFELVGDVGAGKTTFTRGLAAGLDIREPVTSPSFTISKRYVFPLSQNVVKKTETGKESVVKNTETEVEIPQPENPTSSSKNVVKITTSTASPEDLRPTLGQLVHYDFYRLDDPGIMREELSESLSDPNSVIVVEWGASIADLLPRHTIRLQIALQPDGSRDLQFSSSDPQLLASLTQKFAPESTL